MVTHPISPEKAREMLGDKLTRNLGLHGDNLIAVQLHRNEVNESLGILIIHHLGGRLLTPVYLNGDVYNSFFNKSNLIGLSNALDHDFNFSCEIPIDDCTIKRDEIDVTNIHGKLTVMNKTYHVKLFVDLNRSKQEYEVTRVLADRGLYPRIRGLATFQGLPYLVIWDRLDARNCDDYLGEIFSDIYNGQDKRNQVGEMYKACIDVLTEFWKSISNLRGDDERNKWYEKLDTDSYEVHEILGKPLLPRKQIQVIKQWLSKVEFHPIHGDVWLRQFVMSDDQVILMDFEDVGMGPRAYDTAGLLNSILQQGVYFEVDYPQRNDSFSPIKFTKDQVQKLMREFKEEEIIFCQIIRAYHELIYLLKHQPELQWLITHLQDQIVDQSQFLESR